MVLFVSGLLFSLIVISELNWAQCEPKNFAKDDKDIFNFAALHSSTVQPYFAAPRDRPKGLNAKSAIKIWMLVRHASRTPKKNKETVSFHKVENGLRAEIVRNLMNVTECPLSKKNWDNLKKWTWDSKYDGDRELTDSGKKETERVAKNYRERFSHLFKGRANLTSNFNVMSTKRSRCIDSAVIFFDTALKTKPGRSKDFIVVADKTQEEMIKAYKLKNFDDKNKALKKSSRNLVTLFSNTTKYNDVINAVNERLLFKDVDDYAARKKRVTTMYDLCRYEGTWKLGAQSPWCSVFKKSELLVLEYSLDLKTFSQYGPSNDRLNQLNFKQHCATVRDMVTHLSSSSGPKVTAYFIHAPSLMLHLTAMGAFQGPQLTPDALLATRKWKTSKISPMFANLAAVLYQGKEGNTVKFFLNDEVLELPGCKKGVCTVASLEEQFSQCMK